MRDLKFWQEKLCSGNQKFIEAHTKLQGLRLHFKHEIKPFKLNKMYGHKLNRSYDGWKIGKRRRRWLGKRDYTLTQIAALEKFCKKLVQTKLSFYQKKIHELGGSTTDNYWTWWEEFK